MSRSRLTLHSLLVFFLAASGCSDDGPDQLDELPTWHLRETLRIGSVDGSDYPLRSVSELIPLRDGSVLVGQPAATEVPQFGPGGELMRILGQRGQGPGEFQLISNVGVIGDTIWIADFRRRIISFFDELGAHVRSDPVSVGFLPDHPHAYAWTPRLMASEWGVMIPGIAQIAETVSRNASIPVLKTDRSGESLDTLLAWSLEHGYTWIDRDGVSVLVRKPVPWNLATSMSPGGLFFATIAPISKAEADDAVRGLVTLWDRFLRPVWAVEGAAIATEVPTGLLRARAETAARGISGEQEQERFTRALLADGAGSSFPFADAVLVNDRGEVWLQRGYPHERERTWWIFDHRGERQATLHAPEGVQLMAIEGESVWGVYRDELDVPYLVRYTVSAHARI
jgi:hypothetical protein